MIDSMNPKIQSELIQQNAASGGGGSSDLPDITPADYGSYLAVDELGQWGLDIPKTGIDYSTTEQSTGLKWIDGKEIYQISKAGEGSITTPIELVSNVDSVIDFEGYYKVDARGTLFPLGISAGTNVNLFPVKADTGMLILYAPATITSTTYNVTVYYTKPTETKKTTKKK